MMEGIVYRNIENSDYDQLYSLWSSSPGVGLSEADGREPISRYLKKNPLNSFAAFSGARLVGSILAGEDGRRGYLHHLVVHPDFRRKGIGSTLLNMAVERLKTQHIQKCHIFIFTDNAEGISFWKAVGWEYRKDIGVMSLSMPEKGKRSGPDTLRTC